MALGRATPLPSPYVTKRVCVGISQNTYKVKWLQPGQWEALSLYRQRIQTFIGPLASLSGEPGSFLELIALLFQRWPLLFIKVLGAFQAELFSKNKTTFAYCEK